MSETAEHRGAGGGRADFDHSVLAELIAWRWQHDRPYFTLNERASATWLEASCRRQQPGCEPLRYRRSSTADVQAAKARD